MLRLGRHTWHGPWVCFPYSHFAPEPGGDRHRRRRPPQVNAASSVSRVQLLQLHEFAHSLLDIRVNLPSPALARGSISKSFSDLCQLMEQGAETYDLAVETVGEAVAQRRQRRRHTTVQQPATQRQCLLHIPLGAKVPRSLGNRIWQVSPWPGERGGFLLGARRPRRHGGRLHSALASPDLALSGNPVRGNSR